MLLQYKAEMMRLSSWAIRFATDAADYETMKVSTELCEPVNREFGKDVSNQ